MKTFEDCLNEVAVNRGFIDYDACMEAHAKRGMLRYTKSLYLESAVLYASYKEESAFQAGYKRGFEERNKIS